MRICKLLHKHAQLPHQPQTLVEAHALLALFQGQEAMLYCSLHGHARHGIDSCFLLLFLCLFCFETRSCYIALFWQLLHSSDWPQIWGNSPASASQGLPVPVIPGRSQYLKSRVGLGSTVSKPDLRTGLYFTGIEGDLNKTPYLFMDSHQQGGIH